MRLYLRFLYVFFACYATVHTHAQTISPWSRQFPLPELTAFVNFPEPVEKIGQALEKERNNSALKTWVYAVGMDTALDPRTSGQWDSIPEKGYVWRLGIQAENALSLNLLIENFRMQPGMALYAYNKSMENIAGPFDSRNNGNGGVLPVMSLPGDEIIVEWNIPFDCQLSIVNCQLSIVNVGYGFRDMTGGKIPLLAAASCNVDINCKTGNHWQREKRSVVRLETIVKTGGSTTTQYCTGTLMNQAVDAKNKKPYILTAHHCISNDEEAQLTTFVFGYEKGYCDGFTPVIPAGIAGSSLLVTKRELDFTLLEMSRDVSAEQRPYYAGWNTSNTAPRNVAGIHHPQSDVKKISVSNQPLVTGKFSDPETNLYCDDNAHWIVKLWDKGVTEKGSSGSPIFDENHLVVGLLSGGAATCSNPKNDYYSKFAYQWNNKYSVEESLRPWLNPDKKPITLMWGYDPLAPYEDRCDTIGNIGRNEKKILVGSGIWGYLTSQNDRRWISFAEKFENDTIASIIGMEVQVAKVIESGTKIKFAVWRGNDFPVTKLTEKEVTVTADYVNYPMHVYFERKLEVTGNFFIGYTLEYNNQQVLFAAYQALRPYTDISGMYVEESNGTWMAMNEYEPPIYSLLGVRAFGKFGQQEQQYPTSQQRNLKFVYKPGNKIAILLDDIDHFEGPTPVKIECFDMAGKRILLSEQVWGMEQYNETTYLQVELDVDSLPAGIYLIQTTDHQKRQGGKFVKIK